MYGCVCSFYFEAAVLKKIMPFIGLMTCTYAYAEPAEQTDDMPTQVTKSDPQPEKTQDEIDQAIIDDILNEPSKSKPKAKQAAVKPDEDDDKPSPFTSEIEFGFQSHTGNTDTLSLNTRLQGTYFSGPVRYQGEFKAYAENEDGEEDKRQMSYQLQGDYKLGPQSYLYSNFKGIDSKYSSYFHDYTFSAGFGYQVYNTSKLTIETEIGPGYRYQDPNTDEIDDDDPIFPEKVREAIVRGNLNAKWKALKNLEFETEATVVSGESNTRVDTDVSATTNMNDLMALKVSYSRQYLSKVPEGLSNDDTIVTINILFSFN